MYHSLYSLPLCTVMGVCQSPLRCGNYCCDDGWCNHASDGCSMCIKNECQSPLRCGNYCWDDGWCNCASDGCSMCIDNACQPEYFNACMYSMKSASKNGLGRVNKEDVLRVVTKIEARFQGLLVGSPMLLQEDQRLHSRLLMLSLGDHQIVLILEMSHFQN